MNQKLALKNYDLIKETAEIGDFRHYEHNSPFSNLALKICCWINFVEKKHFYEPFGAVSEKETTACVPKFEHFLDIFTDVLLILPSLQHEWGAEYEQVMKGVNDLKQNSKIEQFRHLGLTIIETQNPIHYYALFGKTIDSDLVVSMYNENKYEIEYKYTTWVDIVSRPVMPRIRFDELAQTLNEVEKSGLIWYFDNISDTGPILRLENSELSKAQRFANPNERKIFSSSIEPETFKKTVLEFYQRKYKNISPSNFLPWKEIYKLNELEENFETSKTE